MNNELKRILADNFIEKARKIHGDKFDYSMVVYIDAHTKVKIICPIHGIIHQRPCSHLNTKYGCRQCGTAETTAHIRTPKEVFIKKSVERFGNLLDYSNVIYKNKNTKIQLICSVHGNFSQSPASHFKTYKGCPKCSREVKRTELSSFIEKANKIHNGFYNYDKTIYINSLNKIKIICPTHGEFEQNPGCHLMGQGCRICRIEKGRMSSESFFVKAKEIHNNKYDYSKSEYTTGKSKIIIICPTHGEFEQEARVHMSGSGCRLCFLENNKKTRDEFIIESKNIFGDRFTYDKVDYKTNKTKVIITCRKHGDFVQIPNSHLSGQGCFRCSESSGERVLSRLLDNFKINYIREYKISGYRYKYDFYLPDANIYIEFHGVRHYHPIEFFGGVKKFNKNKRNDAIKRKLVKDNGGTLINISYKHFNLLSNGIYLSQRLKKVYKYWYFIDNVLHVFKNLSSLKKRISQLSNKRFKELF